MARSEIETKIDGLLREDSPMILKSVTAINYDPHPYVIGPRHVKADQMYIDNDLCNRIPCAHPGCGLMLDDHTHDTVAFMQWNRDCTKDEVQDELKHLVDNMDPSDVDGFAFVESDFKLS